MSGRSYAISHTGHLVIAGDGKTKIIDLNFLTRPFRMEIMTKRRELLVIGERNLALINLETDKVVASRQLDFKVICAWRRDNKPLLFDDKGRMHAVNSMDDMTDEKVPVSGKITCFASNSADGLAAYGTSDGTIYLTDSHGQIHKLAGHLSQVTKLKFNGRLLYSSSYDRKLLLWMTGENQIKPITLLQANSWLADFTFDSPQNYIWTGESNGTVTQYLISLPLISQRLKKNVKRNFTRDEWNYYVGKGIPYRKLINE
jgi:WD40 repeat protein